MRDAHRFIRGVAVAALAGCGLTLSCAARSDADTDRLIGKLHDPHWQVRASAAEALGAGSQRAVAPLTEALEDGSAEVRAAAVSSLGRLGAKSALDDVRSLIDEDTDPQVGVQALYALAALADERDAHRQDDIDLLAGKLFAENRRVKRAARRVLLKLVGRHELVELIRADFTSDSKRARTRAAGMARDLKLGELAGWERELLDDDEPGVRRTAYEEIGSSPDHDDLFVLLKGLRDDSLAVRLQAAKGLEKLDDPVALPTLSSTAGADASRPVREAAASAAASISRVAGSPLPAQWHFDRVVDRVVVEREGECALTRTMTLRIDSAPEPVKELAIVVPDAFPQVSSVVGAGGDPLAFKLEWQGERRHAVFNVPSIGTGEATSFTLSARSRRPVFRSGASEILVEYAPAPMQARVDALSVELVLPGGGRAIAPAGLRVDKRADGEVIALERSAVSPRELDSLLLRAAAPTASFKLPYSPPRSYARAGDLATAACVVAVILASLTALIVRLRRTMGERADRAVVVAVLTAGAVVFLTPMIFEDNLAYYSLARSAVLDGDLDRATEYTELNPQDFAPDNRGPLDPLFGSMFQMPLIAGAHALTLATNALSPAHSPNGFSFPYLFFVAAGDFFAVLIGCLACFSLVERRVGERYALFAVLSVVAGTNLLLFAYAWTGSSFQPSFLLSAVFLNHWDKTRDKRSPGAWLGAGVLLGLLGMTRTLNWGLALIPLLDWAHQTLGRLQEEGASGLKAQAGGGALLASGTLLAFAPQLIVQKLVDHVWVMDEYGVGTGRFTGLRDNLWGLFVSRNNALDGLFPAMPVLVLAAVGLALFFRVDRRLATLLTLTLAVQLFAIASYEIYWGYFLYGSPYLVPCAPIFCLAMASLMKTVHSRWRRTGSLVLAGVVVLCAARNGWCVLQQLTDKMIGSWGPKVGLLETIHRLMIDRKLDVDVLRRSRGFGSLVGELAGAVRAYDFGRLAAALFWVALLVLPIVAAYAAAGPIARLTLRVPERARARWIAGALAVAFLAMTGWIVYAGSRTDVDYAYDRERRTERKGKLPIERLEPGGSHTWQITSTNPSDRFSVITFLDGAYDIPAGERVATVDIDADGAKSHLELRAGTDTADFAVDRPELRSVRAHTAPLDRATFEWRVRDESSVFYSARAYATVFKTQNAGRKVALTLTSTLKRGALGVVEVTSQERRVPPDPSRRRWLAERW